MSSADKAAAMEQLQQRLLAADIAPELRRTALQLVMGAGSVHANIVFIGEAPGKNEDEQGVPFVGAAGKFLDEMLASIQLNRGDVYITNIVKYRPPNNRDPSPSEKRAFWPYLLQQLQIIQPKMVVTLGRHSMEYFLPDVAISHIHGQPQQVNVEGYEVMVMPLYHPAAALYNGALRQTLLDDFSQIPGILKSIS